MARLPRLALAGHAHHLIHRGNNGQAVFADAADREAYLALLRESAQAAGVAVHAYVLLDSEVQLLATPESDAALSRMMQGLGRRYVGRFNRRHGRSGTLWEGRFRATVIETDRYLLGAMAAIEMAPVRAGLVQRAEHWPWSSHGHHAGLRRDPLIASHLLYWRLGNTPFERELAYRGLLEHGPSDSEVHRLGQAALKGWVLGSPEFVAALTAATARPLLPRRRGRPRKDAAVAAEETVPNK